MRDKIKKALTEAFIVELYSETKAKRQSNGQYLGLCPFHDDKTPSFSFDPTPGRLGVYRCFTACEARGNIYTYIREIKGIEDPFIWLQERIVGHVPIAYEKRINTSIKTIDKEIILKAKEDLLGNGQKLKELQSLGISEEVVKKYNIGFGNNRFWFPIKNETGKFVNVRKYSTDTKGTGNKVISFGPGYGTNRLWPIESLNSDNVYIFEGEKDTAVALSLGLNAITNTTGAASWTNNWGSLFRDKNVIICMDVDKDGENGARIREKNIRQYSTQIKIIKLPLDKKKYPKGDFADYITKEKRTIDDFLQLVDSASPITSEEKEEEEKIYPVILAEASRNQYINKKCAIKNVLCCGKDANPFAAPKTINARCTGKRDDKKCLNCSLNIGDITKTIEKDDDTLLSYIKVTSEVVNLTIKKNLKINQKCFQNTLDISEYYNVENIRIMPEVSYNIEENYEHVYRSGYLVLDAEKYIKTNKSYSITAKTVLDKKTQHVVHQIFDHQESESNIDKFVLDDLTIKKLKKFQVDKEKGETIKSKLDDIYSEFSKMARVYGREDVFAIMDLSFHSPLTFDFQGKNIGKGWIETCVMGDSGVGKSTQAKFLMDHYKAGEFVSGEGAGYTGLIGGISQHAGVWTLQWGTLPINDRRLVIIDEATGIKEEDIAKFSDIRSSGEAKIQKIVQEKTRARTRIIWISNPRKANMGIKNYPYGVKAIAELFGMPEDVRRLDAAIISASGDIDPSIINREPDNSFIPLYDSDSCHNLIKFAWALEPKGIYIPKETTSYILEKSLDLSKKYSASIPLLEPSDTRIKIAKAATTWAIRTFNFNEETRQIEVEPGHVDYHIDLLDSVYSSNSFGYRRFSLQEFQKDNLKNPRKVAEILHIQEDYAIAELLNSPTISKSILKDILEEDFVEGASFRMGPNAKKRELKKNNAIREHSNYYVLQPGLLTLLKDLKQWYEDGRGDMDEYFNEKHGAEVEDVGWD